MAQKKRYSKRVFANIRVSSVKQTGWGLNIWNGIFIVGLFDDFVHQEITFLVSLSRRIPWGAMGFFFRTTRELEYLFIFQNLTLGYMTKTQNQIIIFFLHQNQNIFSATLEVKWSVPFILTECTVCTIGFTFVGFIVKYIVTFFVN